MFTYQLQEEILEAYREIVYNKIPAKISRLFHGSERCRKVCTYRPMYLQEIHVSCLSCYVLVNTRRMRNDRKKCMWEEKLTNAGSKLQLHRPIL